jgi:hypothetical protein
MVSPSPSRRGFLRASAALASVGAVGALAGCSGGSDGGDGSGGDGDAPVERGPDSVPEQSSSIFQIDFEEMRTNEDIKRVMEANMEGEASSFEESMDEFESEQGVDPRDVSMLVGFADSDDSMGSFDTTVSADSYGGAVAWTNLSSDELVTAVQENSEASFSESTYSGTTLYTDDESGQVFAALGGGVFVAGNEQAVKDVVDLSQGSGSAVSGKLRSSFTGTREAPIRFALEIPESTGSDGSGSAGGFGGATQNMSHVSGAILYSSGNNLGMQFNLVFDSSETASQMSQMANQFIEQYKMQAESQQGGEELAQMLEQISVTQDGDTVSVTYEDSVENIIAAMEEGTSGTGIGGMTGGGI